MSEKRRIVIQNSRNKSILRGNPAKRPKRTNRKPDRFGARISASNRDEFFDQLSSNTDSDDSNNDRVQIWDTINLIESSDASSNGYISSSDELVAIGDNGRTTPSEINNVQSQAPETNGGRTNTLEVGDVQTSVDETNDQHSPVEGICSCDKHKTPPGSNEHVIIAKLDEILKRISSIDKNTAKMEVRMRNLEETVARAEIDVGKRASDNEQDSIQLGLPIKNQESLNKLEED